MVVVVIVVVMLVVMWLFFRLFFYCGCKCTCHSPGCLLACQKWGLPLAAMVWASTGCCLLYSIPGPSPNSPLLPGKSAEIVFCTKEEFKLPPDFPDNGDNW